VSPPARSADVAVVGAGPAGAAAAITLARAGCDVVLLDKATFPRDKFCGDGLTAGALRRLEDLGLDPAAVASWTDVHDVVLRTPAGREVAFELPRERGRFAAVARRADLDAALVDVARRAGAEVLDGHAVTAVRQDDDAVHLTAEGVGTVDARYVVAADGMWSPVRKLLGVEVAGYRGEWHAFRQYVDGVSPEASRALFVSFEPDFLPGYFWSFPVGEHGANIGFGIQRGHSFRVGAMKALWPEILARPHIRRLLGPDAVAEGPHRAWPIPARIDQMSTHHGRTLFVGDAVAATDALTGEGIGQALATGMWAADAIVAQRSGHHPHVGQRYDRAVRHGLVADHRMSVLLARALSHRKGVRFAVRLAGANDWTRRNFARWLFEDYPRAIVATPRRWAPGMFSSPGAWAHDSDQPDVGGAGPAPTARTDIA
jgi:geranylgeranyl reductase family protein